MSDFDEAMLKAIDTIDALISDHGEYIRTPRCDTCTLWSHDGFVHDAKSEGRCLVLGSDDAPVMTYSHFGCVKWE